MKKTYKLENLCCANCAAKIETAINKISGIDNATIAFMAQRLTIDAENQDAVLPDVEKAIKKIERKCVLVK